MSCSYGPGRYDPDYELQGHDYPIGFVRWTEQRNFQAVLHALSVGALRTEPLISHRFPIDLAAAAYELLSSPETSLGILLQYPGTADPHKRTIDLSPEAADSRVLRPGQPSLSVIGAGNYASRMLIPAFAKAGARFHPLPPPVVLALFTWGASLVSARPAPMCLLCWLIQVATPW